MNYGDVMNNDNKLEQDWKELTTRINEAEVNPGQDARLDTDRVSQRRRDVMGADAGQDTVNYIAVLAQFAEDLSPILLKRKSKNGTEAARSLALGIGHDVVKRLIHLVKE
jgi:hypothetical protein